MEKGRKSIDLGILNVFVSDRTAYVNGVEHIRFHVIFHSIAPQYNSFIFCDVICYELVVVFNVLPQTASTFTQQEESLIRERVSTALKEESGLPSLVFDPIVDLILDVFQLKTVETLPSETVEILPFEFHWSYEIRDFGDKIPQNDGEMIIQQNVLGGSGYYSEGRNVIYILRFILRPGYLYRESPEKITIPEFMKLRNKIRQQAAPLFSRLKDHYTDRFKSEFGEMFNRVDVRDAEGINLGFYYVSWASPVMFDTHPEKAPTYHYTFLINKELWMRTLKGMWESLDANDFKKVGEFVAFIAAVSPIEQVERDGYLPCSKDEVSHHLSRFLAHIVHSKPTTDATPK